MSEEYYARPASDKAPRDGTACDWWYVTGGGQNLNRTAELLNRFGIFAWPGGVFLPERNARKLAAAANELRHP